VDKASRDRPNDQHFPSLGIRIVQRNFRRHHSRQVEHPPLVQLIFRHHHYHQVNHPWLRSRIAASPIFTIRQRRWNRATVAPPENLYQNRAREQLTNSQKVTTAKDTGDQYCKTDDINTNTFKSIDIQ